MTNPLLILFLFITIVCYGQNEIVFSLPELNKMYVGYDNVVQIGFTKKWNRIVNVECNNCDSIRRHPTDNTKWIVKPKQKGELTLTVIGKRGKVLDSKSYKTFSPPEPKMYLAKQNAQSIIQSIPDFLVVKYDTTVPLHTVFMIRSWEIKIGEEIFLGKSSKLSDEVKKYAKSIGSGTMIININYLGPNGEKELKEIFEFVIE